MPPPAKSDAGPKPTETKPANAGNNQKKVAKNPYAAASIKKPVPKLANKPVSKPENQSSKNGRASCRERV